MKRSSGKPVKRVEKVIITDADAKRKSKPSSAKHLRSKKSAKGHSTARSIGAGVGKVIFAAFLIFIIIGSIVGTAMTVFIMRYVNADPVIDLDALELGYTTVIYGTNFEGEEIELQKITSGGYRTWVSIDKIPQMVQDAFMYSEDERFKEHEGVDWARTFGAFAGWVASKFGVETSGFGASTITQQLVKNINSDFYQRTGSTKLKEIMMSLNLERHYSKDKILEAYLNYINLGNNTYGVEAASQKYFNKSVSELTVSEAAMLAVIPKSPSKYEPINNYETNIDRRNRVSLAKLLEFNCITQEEYDAAVADMPQIFNIDLSQNENDTFSTIYSWYVDEAIRSVQADFASKYNVSSDEALDMINNGGYRIYTPMISELQNVLEDAFLDDSLFEANSAANAITYTNSAGEQVTITPSAAMVIMDYEGYVLAIVGDRGAKTSSLCWSNASGKSRLSPGSCMKPITVYAPAIDNGTITWSTLLTDEPIEAKGDDGKLRPWPENYGGPSKWTYAPITMQKALEVSKNTIPAQLIKTLTPEYCFNFLTQDLGITTLLDDESEHLALTIGGLDEGLKLTELVAAYEMFGNGGMHYAPKAYTQVVDTMGNVILDNSYDEGNQAISEQSAYVMNRLLNTVITGSEGTGRAAAVSGYDIVGKTGTSSFSEHLSFVGCTPSFVSGIWLGYSDIQEEIPSTYSPAKVWGNIMSLILPLYYQADETFEAPEGVVQMQYCTHTGLLATNGCPSTAVGYYDSSQLPGYCTTHGSH